MQTSGLRIEAGGEAELMKRGSDITQGSHGRPAKAPPRGGNGTDS